MSLSTHVLDTSLGRPAPGVPVIVSAQTPGGWTEIGRGATDGDGRIASLLPAGAPAAAGTTLRLRFDSAAYFSGMGVQAFYPYVDVVFTLLDTGHHHIPLLLSPFGYSTYRGS